MLMKIKDIGEKVLSYFRNRANSSGNSNGRARMGLISSATGSVLHPRMDIENSSAFDKGTYEIITLVGRYIISKDGEVQEHGPLTISIADPSVVVGGHVIGRLVAVGRVRVLNIYFFDAKITTFFKRKSFDANYGFEVSGSMSLK